MSVPPSRLLPSYICRRACSVLLGGKRAQAAGAHVQAPPWVALALVTTAGLCLAGRQWGPQAIRAQTGEEMGLIRGLLHLSLASSSPLLCLEAEFIDLTLIGWQLCLVSSDPVQPWDSLCLWSQGMWGRAEGRKEFLFIQLRSWDFSRTHAFWR